MHQIVPTYLISHLNKLPHNPPLPDEHKLIIDERLNSFDINAEPSVRWEYFRDELLEKLRKI